LLSTTSSPSRGTGFFFFGRLLGRSVTFFPLADQFGHKGLHPDDGKHQCDAQSNELGRGPSRRLLATFNTLETVTIDNALIFYILMFRFLILTDPVSTDAIRLEVIG